MHNTTPLIMRRYHLESYRIYTQRLILSEARRDEDEVCDLPFCLEPMGQVQWINCEKCERWLHMICHGLEEIPKDQFYLSCALSLLTHYHETAEKTVDGHIRLISIKNLMIVELHDLINFLF